ncbi:MAG TPA: sulfur oxidation c-type cytochrome SoxX [Burkholderiales bacterium]|jgi:sulfur-oxidizing protein SoxX|nr:sulfur oxidation c-type cytochrome SoxX [Burkholderiales bacterium]
MKTVLFAVLAACATAAAAEPTPAQVQATLERDFHAKGQATLDRTAQDALQRVCTDSHDNPPAGLVKALQEDQMKTIAWPSGSLMGDWKRGEKIAQSGKGMTWKDKPGKAAGGSCYNCHQLSPKEESFGTIGPSLRGLGKTRGTSAQAQRYVYGKIYDAKAYALCSQMPRFGTSGTLDEQQIKDLVGLLLDPASPVNQ